MQEALTRNRDMELTKEDAMIIGRDPAHPALFINSEGEKFIGSDERFFQIKEKENVFTLYARKGTGLLSCLRPRKKKLPHFNSASYRVNSISIRQQKRQYNKTLFYIV